MLEGMVFLGDCTLYSASDIYRVQSRKSAPNMAQQLLALDVQALSITMCLKSSTTHSFLKASLRLTLTVTLKTIKIKPTKSPH